MIKDFNIGLDGIFFFQAEDGIRDGRVTGVQTCALPIYFVIKTEAEIQAYVDHVPIPEASVLQITPQPLVPPRTDIDALTDENRKYELVANHWAECSWLMHRVSQVVGIKYFHFLQVNQHH